MMWYAYFAQHQHKYGYSYLVEPDGGICDINLSLVVIFLLCNVIYTDVA